MPRAHHPCAHPGCPTAVPPGKSRCASHQRQRERARGTRQQRGYDRTYDQTRARTALAVAKGDTRCTRCGHPIDPREPWDLGHDDNDRSIIRGPEHRFCNRSAAGKAAHE